MPRRPAHPNCYIIAGPNGVGKTTFATEFLPLYVNCRNFINADLIARGLSPFAPDAGMLRAGRTVLERIAEFTAARTDFAFRICTMKKSTKASLTQQAMQALSAAVAKVVKDHQRRGRPLAVWRDGKAVWISATGAAARRENPTQ